MGNSATVSGGSASWGEAEPDADVCDGVMASVPVTLSWRCDDADWSAVVALFQWARNMPMSSCPSRTRAAALARSLGTLRSRTTPTQLSARRIM